MKSFEQKLSFPVKIRNNSFCILVDDTQTLMSIRLKIKVFAVLTSNYKKSMSFIGAYCFEFFGIFAKELDFLSFFEQWVTVKNWTLAAALLS